MWPFQQRPAAYRLHARIGSANCVSCGNDPLQTPYLRIYELSRETVWPISAGNQPVTQDELSLWATQNGWRMMAGCPSLAKPGRPKDAIVRLSFKVTVVSLEVRKATKWEKMASAKYEDVTLDAEGERVLGLGFEKVPSITMLMRENKDAQVFAKFGN